MNIPENPAGWIMQEKLDGVFCRWTGSAFLSRNGHRFTPPRSWYDRMPTIMMDGEIWMGRGTFDSLVSTIQKKGSDWTGVTYRPFDLPLPGIATAERLAKLHSLDLPSHVMPITSRLCIGRHDLDRSEMEVVASGGEGLILRDPSALYRCGHFAKVKRLFPDLDRSILD